jgi:hypothetical protein
MGRHYARSASRRAPCLFDANRPLKLKTLARHRILGAILDLPAAPGSKTPHSNGGLHIFSMATSTRIRAEVWKILLFPPGALQTGPAGFRGNLSADAHPGCAGSNSISYFVELPGPRRNQLDERRLRRLSLPSIPAREPLLQTQLSTRSIHFSSVHWRIRGGDVVWSIGCRWFRVINMGVVTVPETRGSA